MFSDQHTQEARANTAVVLKTGFCGKILNNPSKPHPTPGRDSPTSSRESLFSEDNKRQKNEPLLEHVADSFVERFLDSKLLLYCIEVCVTPHRYWDLLLRLTDACVTIWYVTTCYRVTQKNTLATHQVRNRKACHASRTAHHFLFLRKPRAVSGLILK